MNERSRIEEAFEQALEQDVMARSQFLEAIREANPQVAAEVEQLLRAHDRSAGILDGVGRKAPRMPERRIGTYRVVTELGRGGMGVVYLAERDDGQFRRRVAVGRSGCRRAAPAVPGGAADPGYARSSKHRAAHRWRGNR
jgi:hypothetical protein